MTSIAWLRTVSSSFVQVMRVFHLASLDWGRNVKHSRVLSGKDAATNDGGLARPNLMETSYIWTDVGQPLTPQGGRTAGLGMSKS